MSQDASLKNEDMPLATEQQSRGKYLALGMTLAVHVLLLVLLVLGVRWTTHTNDAVEVELVRAPESSAPVAAPSQPDAPRPTLPTPPTPPPPHPAPDTAPTPRIAPRPVPHVEAKPAPSLPKPDVALKDEEKKQPPPKKLAPVPPNVSPPQDDLLRKQLEQEIRQATAQRRSMDYSNDAARELTNLQRAAASAATAKAMGDYIARIRGRIRSNIVLPPDIKGNPEAIFDVTQFPSGEILDVKLKKSSGHAGYDVAVERAIRKSSPLPKPERPDLFSRELELKFHPLED